MLLPNRTDHGIILFDISKVNNPNKYAISFMYHSVLNCFSGAAFAEDCHNLPLYLPLVVPFTLGNIDRIHFRISRLETYSVSLFLLKETFQGGSTISLQVDGNYNITIFARILWFNDHIIFIANMVFDH